MLKKIKIIIASLAITLTGTIPVLVPAAASAGIQGALCSGSESASSGQVVEGGGSGCQSDIGNAQGNGIKRVAGKIVTIISIVVGVISVIFIIYGGFRYITSGGDSGKVGSAKNTLIYAVIGLVVVALAQVIVNVVLTTATSVTSNS